MITSIAWLQSALNFFFRMKSYYAICAPSLEAPCKYPPYSQHGKKISMQSGGWPTFKAWRSLREPPAFRITTSSFFCIKYIYSFCWTVETKSLNISVSLSLTDCVIWNVRTENLILLKDFHVSETVSWLHETVTHLYLNLGTRDQSLLRMCGNCADRWHRTFLRRVIIKFCEHQYNIATYSYSSSCIYCQKDKRAKNGNIKIKQRSSRNREHWKWRCCHLSLSLQRVLIMICYKFCSRPNGCLTNCIQYGFNFTVSLC